MSSSRGAAIEHPRLVAIETTNRCNAKCPFCPNNSLARDRLTMSDDLFGKIVEDCRAFPLPAIEPFLNGEPFMDPKIIARLALIRSRLPNTKLRLYSNGRMMTRARIDEMTSLGIDRIFISLNTLNPEKYKSIMGFDLDATLENMAYLADPVRRRKVARHITLRMTRLNDTPLREQDDFIAYCRKLGVTPMVVGLFNYKGDIPGHLPVPHYPCEHITRLDILASGKATLCCMDQEGQYPWGDLNTQSVLEVFNGPAATRYKTAHRTGRRTSMPPCGECNLFWPSFSHMPLWRQSLVALEAGAYFLRYRPNGRKAPTE